MKKYTLEIFIDQDTVKVEGIHEKYEELTVADLRLLVSVLEEYKTRMVLDVIARQQQKIESIAQTAKKVD